MFLVTNIVNYSNMESYSICCLIEELRLKFDQRKISMLIMKVLLGVWI